MLIEFYDGENWHKIEHSGRRNLVPIESGEGFSFDVLWCLLNDGANFSWA